MSKTGAWLTGGLLFTALSAADFVQTYALIEGGPAHEANPVAAEWLARHGWVGLAVFKGLVCLCVMAAVGVLAKRRPAVGARVLALGCATLLAVGVYSRGLIVAEAAEDEFQMSVSGGQMVEFHPANPHWVSHARPPRPLPL